MNDLERFRGTMNYGEVDRAPIYEFMWPTWPETAERWAREGGYIPGQTDFGCDKWLVEFSWFWPQPPFAREIVGEDDEHVTFVDPQGIVMREFKNNPLSSMPQFIRYPVETREDFRKYWRERMQPDLTQRIGPDWRQRLRALRDRDFPFVVIADRWGGFFGPLRNLVGVERLCTLFYDDPAFVEEMLDADADYPDPNAGANVGRDGHRRLRLLGGHGLPHGSPAFAATGPEVPAAALPQGGGLRPQPRREIIRPGQ